MATTTATTQLPRPVSRTPYALRVILILLVFVSGILAIASSALALLDLAARHEFTTRASYPGVRVLAIDNSVGDVHLVGTPAGAPVSVRTHVTEGLRTPHRSITRGPGSVLHLGARCSDALGGASCDVGYTVAVPPDVHVHQVSASGGDISARDLVSRDVLVLDSNGGDISLAGVRAPSLYLHSSAGDVTTTGISASIVSATSSAGDVRVELVAPPRHVAVNSSAGDVHLTVPNLVYALKASSSGGDVFDHDVRQDPRSPRKIDATSSAGDVRISVQR
jgi:hypothetical protein